jgi:hypothetical protein
MTAGYLFKAGSHDNLVKIWIFFYLLEEKDLLFADTADFGEAYSRSVLQ